MSSLPLPTLRSGAKERIDEILVRTVEGRTLPAIFLGATNAKETIYWNQAGERVFGDASAGEVDEDTYTEIFSQTKFITCLAALQLVDQGLVSLDSEEDVAKHLPEIADIPLIKGYDSDGQAILEKPKNKVTLRMLMSHSAGFVYAHDDTLVSQWLKANPTPGIFDPKAGVEALSTPLIYEPGTSYKYGVGIDWAGILVERVSGLNLENYFRQHIFEPVGAKSMTFYPTTQVKAKKMAVCSRNAEGKVQVIPGGFGMGRPQEPEQVGLLLGGAGLFGTQKDYLAVLRAVLQCDPRYVERPGKPLLSPKSYNEMFKPSLPRGEGYTGCDRLFEMVDRPKYFDSPSPDNVNHSVAFLVNQSPWKGRRKAPSGCWSGAAKTQFWIDPESGIAAVVGTQLLSPAPDPWFATYVEYETALYAGLQ
ncbi:hypothetical protein EHS25_002785 [Saitozyma podzolica]|uniref:Beta-lactamase-related domain-containing protein n=1 Tax=Saitozyma podzolica TaxID=1890683 RepID=A0A427YD67_9TREE|nr:hypothetical protein EHS25_002785 [Saitozyma podzolica]